MPKKQTKAQKLTDWYTVFKTLRTVPILLLKDPYVNMPIIKRETNRDGSIPTHPIFDGLPEKPESEVLTECVAWLRQHNILVWRNNTGSGTLGTSGFYHYGITDGGDLIGLLPSGVHIEIECKAGKGGRWSAGQMARKVEIEKNNGIYLLIHGVQEIEYYFKELGLI